MGMLYHRAGGQTPAQSFMFRLFSRVLVPTLLFSSAYLFAETQKPAPDSAVSAQRAIKLADSGHCTEALPLLRNMLTRIADKETKIKAGASTVRCALSVDQREAALDALKVLNHDYPRDPEVMYLSTHAYSDLSMRASQDLARFAPSSLEAHQMSAEALELQGKWDEAAKEYRWILQQNPHLAGIHFRLGRVYLSKPDAGPAAADEARQQFESELQVDPFNPGAEYVLGELARQSSQWEVAESHFSRAAKLDAGFGDAYLGWGASLLAQKRFAESVAPLERAVKLEPQNPTAHFDLATAYNRTGKKEEGQREFAIHRQLADKSAPPDSGQGQTAGSPQQ
jgi:tetratricopeptide (TPR) repeat protein